MINFLRTQTLCAQRKGLSEATRKMTSEAEQTRLKPASLSHHILGYPELEILYVSSPLNSQQ